MLAVTTSLSFLLQTTFVVDEVKQIIQEVSYLKKKKVSPDMFLIKAHYIFSL